jgi:hypothetical protein
MEHEPQYVDQTRKLLQLHDLQAFAEVRYAPLQSVALPGHSTSWYAPEQVYDMEDIGLLLVDGPPNAIGPNARYPAVPILHDSLSRRVTILLDDAARKNEAEVAERWRSDQLRNFEYSELGLSRGLAQFTRRPATEG